MAGNWIKMRGTLLDSPKIIIISRLLHANTYFQDWLVPRSFEFDREQLVTDAALRCVTVSLLLRVWSVATEHGKLDGNDLIMPMCRPEDIDQMAGAPGVGDAMLKIGWLIDLGEDIGVSLPNFKEYNVPMSAAERQRAYRDRENGVAQTLREPRNKNVTELSRVELSISLSDREKKELFSAVAEITASDPKTSGSYVGRACKDLCKADPPYTASEVRKLASILKKRGFTLPLTLGTVSKYIGWTRDQFQKVDGKTLDETGEAIKQNTLRKRAERQAHESATRQTTTPKP